MKQYLDLLKRVKEEGIRQENRTGIDTLTLPGAMLQFDLQQGFPAITTKRLAFNQVRGELIGFLNGFDNAADFRKVGCTIWDQNANENLAWRSNPNRQGTDDLGPIYGVQWRYWRGRHKLIDQIQESVGLLRQNPFSRRILVNAWNPDELNQMALPPCHIVFQLIAHPGQKKLHMTMYQRSCDMFLGVPFNIASYAMLLSLYAKWSGLEPGTLTMFLADNHIYVNHLAQVETQLLREPKKLPTLIIDDSDFDMVHLPADNFINALKHNPNRITLDNYDCHESIKAEMAV